MKILNISNMPVWLWGEGKGIPSIFLPQKELASKGHEVHFLCPVKGAERAGRSAEVEGVRIYRFDFPFNLRGLVYIQTDTVLGRIRAWAASNLNWLAFQISASLAAARAAPRIKPDIVYAHNLTSALPGWIAARRSGAKLVMRVYGTRGLYWSWDNLFIRLKEWRDHLAFMVPADVFIITDDGSRGDIVAGRMGVPGSRIRYWRNGIDEAMYEQVPSAKDEICALLKIDPSSRVIASTCRLIPDYGVDRLLTAFARLSSADERVVCVIAGSGFEERRLKDLAVNAGISSRVSFAGIIDRSAIKRLLQAADIFVYVPRHYNCTNTIWEAMACGSCIVTTETDPVKEVLRPGEDAILVSEREADQRLPGILRELLNDASRRKSLGENSRRRAREVLEPWGKRVEKEIELLEGLTGGR